MPKIYEKDGVLYKEGSNGCEECGQPIDNKSVLGKAVEKASENTKVTTSKKKKEVTSNDD